MKYPWVAEGVKCVCITQAFDTPSILTMMLKPGQIPKFMQTYTISGIVTHSGLFGTLGINLAEMAPIWFMDAYYPIVYGLESADGKPNFAPLEPLPEAVKEKEVDPIDA